MTDIIVLSVVAWRCSGSGLPANIQLDIDGDRETERIYSLFHSYMSKLEKMQGRPGSRRAISAGGRWPRRRLPGPRGHLELPVETPGPRSPHGLCAFPRVG